jgi:hypothetical protein
MIAVSGVFLLYTAMIVPIQLFLWSYENPCIIFPTLYLDLIVDLFFLVDTPPRMPDAYPSFEGITP